MSDTSPSPNELEPNSSTRRDSLYSDRVLYETRPSVLRVPSTYKLASWVLGVTALVTTLFFIATTRVVQHPSAGMLLTAFWAATVSVLVRGVPLIWIQGARYLVTERYVIWQRGRYKRVIQRDGVSFARFRWYKRLGQVGDIDLVRAVPTGALRRKLSITFQGVRNPEHLWAIVRGTEPPQNSRGYDTPVPQRLDPGERVLWQAEPVRNNKAWLPLETRRWSNALLGVLVVASSLRPLFLASPLAQKLVRAGVRPTSLEFVTIFGAMGFTVALLLGFGGWLIYRGVLQDPLDDKDTNYYLTDKRIVVRVGRREIHVILSHVVDLMVHRNAYGTRDVYLILDGPRARAFSVQGAFGSGEQNQGFQPVLKRLGNEQAQSLGKAMEEATRKRLEAGKISPSSTDD